MSGFDGGNSTRLTRTGTMIGTPAYMSPEQFRGGPGEPRSDQFSFCVALHEALTGRRPFAGSSIRELMDNVVRGQVLDAPVATRAPAWIRHVLLRGLRTDPDDRFPTMGALLHQLSGTPQRTRRRWVAAVTIVGTMAALMVAARWRSQRDLHRCSDGGARLTDAWDPTDVGKNDSRRQLIHHAFLATHKTYAGAAFSSAVGSLDRYAKDWGAMHRDVCEATHVRHEQSIETLDLRMSCLSDRLAELGALTALFAEATGEVVSHAAQAAQSMRPIADCADVASLRALVRPPDDVAVRRVVSELRRDLVALKAMADAGRYRNAMKLAPAMLDRARQTGYRPVEAEVLQRLGWLHTLGGNPQKAEEVLQEAASVAIASRHDEVATRAATALAFTVGHLQGRHTDGMLWARFAAALLARLGSGNELLGAWQKNDLGAVYLSARNLNEALTSIRESLAIKRRILGTEHFDVMVGYLGEAVILGELGRIVEATDVNSIGLRGLRRILGDHHPLVADALSNHARFMNARERYDEAIGAGEEAVAIYDREVEPDHPYLADPLTALGWSWILKGDPAKAIPFLERAVRIRESSSQDPAWIGETKFALARALAEGGGARARAMSLAQQAREAYGRAVRREKEIAEVDGWIASQARDGGRRARARAANRRR